MIAIATFFVCLFFWFIGYSMGAEINTTKKYKIKLKIAVDALRIYAQTYDSEVAEDALEKIEED